MISLLADEDLHRGIVEGILLRNVTFDFITAEQAGLLGAADSAVLKWACENHRIVVSHDCNTMIGEAKKLLASGQPMAGLFVVRQSAGLGRVINDLLFIHDGSDTADWEGKIEFFPFS